MLPAYSASAERPFSAGDFRVPTAYLDLLVGRDVSRTILQRAGISDAGQGGCPDFLPSIVFMNLCLERIRAMGDEAYGICAQPVPRGAFGLLMAAASQADTFSEALVRFAEAARIIRPDLDLKVHLNRARLQISIMSKDISSRHDLMVETFALTCQCAFRWLTGAQLTPLHVKVADASPAFPRSLLNVLGAPLLRKGTGVVISYPRSSAGLPVLAVKYQHWAAQELGEFMRLLEEAARRRNPADPPGEPEIVARVLDLLKQGLHDEVEVAVRLGMSPASLRRRLKEVNHTFRAISAIVRRQSAASLLVTDKALEDVAAELGFADTRSLRRACRVWFGMSPSEYRGSSARTPSRTGSL